MEENRAAGIKGNRAVDDGRRGGRTRAFLARAGAWIIPALLFALTPSVWTERSVLFCAEARAWKKFPMTVRWDDPGGGGRAKQVTVSVRAGHSRIRMALPVGGHIERLRIQLGRGPNEVTLVHPTLRGKRTLRLSAADFTNVLAAHFRAGQENVAGGFTVVAESAAAQLTTRNGIAVRPRFRVKGIVTPLLWLLALRWACGIATRAIRGAGAAAAARWRDGCLRDAPGERIFAFDLARVLAFAMVAFGHTILDLPEASGARADYPFFRICVLGVSFFIVLSGASLSLRSFGGGFAAFYRKRIAAVFPAYWIAYGTTALLAYVSAGRVAFWTDPEAGLQTVFGLDGFLQSRCPWNYYLVGEWFVGFILLMYLAAPALHAAIRRRALPTLAVCALVSYWALRHSGGWSDATWLFSGEAHRNVPSRLAEFAFGMAFAMKIRPKYRRYVLTAMGAALYLAVYAGLWKRSVFAVDFAGLAAQACVFCVAVFVFDSFPCRVALRGIVRRLAGLSFLAFLYHHWILQAVVAHGPTVSGPAGPLYVWASVLLFSYALAGVTSGAVKSVQRLFAGDG